MNEVIRYIIQFLAGENKDQDMTTYIGYTSDASAFDQFKVVIIPSGFFDGKMYGTPSSIPELPLSLIEDIPLLFGEPKTEWAGETLVIHADIIASAYFLLSRYEEIIRRDVRDIHGRFPGKESLPFKAGFIHRPVVDLYGRLLRRWLIQTGVRLNSKELTALKNIYLTHDVDAPFYCRTWRNVMREVKNGAKLQEAIRIKNGPLERDPYYTFPWFLEENKNVCTNHPNCRVILFFKTGGKSEEDKPRYNLHSKDIQSLLRLANKYNAWFGLHSSYEAGAFPKQIRREAKRFELIENQQKSKFHRSHFLASREPEDMNYIEQAGFTDDFTLGYADIAGFRLGTARAVRFIDPVKKRLSPTLNLHPLVIMDCTLSEAKYMGLNEEDAYRYCIQMIREIKQVHGELVLLWHNTSFAEVGGYHRTVYHNLLKALNL